jgi:hypothetical protein
VPPGQKLARKADELVGGSGAVLTSVAPGKPRTLSVSLFAGVSAAGVINLPSIYPTA